MARAMTSGANNPGRLVLLPPALAHAVRRALARITGLGVAAAAVALGLALVSYTPGDPSFNSAAGGPVHNLLGLPGAHVADLLLQITGLAAGLIVVVLAAWGWRLILCRPVRRLWLRLALLPVGLGFAMIALAAVATPEAWPLRAGLGGITGTLLLAGCLRLADLVGLANAGTGAIGFAAAALALGTLLPALTFSGREWVGFGRILGRGLRRLAAALRAIARRMPSLVPAATNKTGIEARVEPVLDEPQPAAGEPAAEAAASGAAHPPPPSFLVEPHEDRPLRPGRRARASRQQTLDLGDTPRDYQLPELGLLGPTRADAGGTAVDREGLEQNARLLESVLEDFGVKGEIIKVRPGPVVTLYELLPAPGTKSSRVIGLSDDIARSMSAVSVRVAVIPGRNAIGIELPNSRREIVLLRELLESESYERSGAKLPLVLGKDIAGTPVITDLARMPHLLIAGTTGSGKSVAINTMILSLLYRLPPDQCKFIMIDPKMLELSVYDGIPQLLAPVVTEPQKAVVALKWTVREMEGRYQSMAKLGVRNVEGYNARIAEARRKGEVLHRRVQTGFDPDTGAPVYDDRPLDLEPLPYIVVIVDEMADLMLVAGKDIEAAVQRLSQMARAAGIHLIMATQRPSVDVITGTIKANFPFRVSFQVTSKIDSRTILGEQGAETLLGQGDMLHMSGGGRITRVHGPFVSDREVEEVVRFLKAQGAPAYIESITEEDETSALPGFAMDGGDADDLYRQAVELVCREGKASTSFVQRHLQIGYNRAARLIERMEAEGLISAANHVGRREVLLGRVPDSAG